MVIVTVPSLSLLHLRPKMSQVRPKEAFQFAWELLQQLAPAFEEHIAGILKSLRPWAHRVKEGREM